MTEHLHSLVEKLRDKVREQDEFIEKLGEAALTLAVVVDAAGDRLLVSTKDKLVAINATTGTRIGDFVLLHPESGQIITTSPFVRNLGQPCVIEDRLTAERFEVLRGGERTIVGLSEHIDPAKATKGSTALLDGSGLLIVEVLSPPKAETIAEFKPVLWEHIGGNVEAKTELIEAIEMIRGGTSLHTAYRTHMPKGVLLYGPPGCGKTMLGKAVATELGSKGFIYVKAPEILNMYVGNSEERVRRLFRSAHDHKRATGQMAVIFIDEADAILQKRGTGKSSDMEKTIVPAFLTEMDGLAESSAFIILATNRADTLDPAVIREGRIDAKIEVRRPNKGDTTVIFETYLRGLPTHGCTIEDLSVHGSDLIFGDEHHKANVSGAYVAAAVERAKRQAIRRDGLHGKATGITKADIEAALTKGH